MSHYWIILLNLKVLSVFFNVSHRLQCCIEYIGSATITMPGNFYQLFDLDLSEKHTVKAGKPLSIQFLIVNNPMLLLHPIW